MTESEVSIRESLLSTLSFFASEAEQQEFASKVFYKNYLEEFSCWWFDTFLPDEPSALAMFSPSQLITLREFSKVFERSESGIESDGLTILQLQSMIECKTSWLQREVLFQN